MRWRDVARKVLKGVRVTEEEWYKAMKSWVGWWGLCAD